MKKYIIFLFSSLSCALMWGQHLSIDFPLSSVAYLETGQTVHLSPYQRADFSAISLVMDAPGLSAEGAQVWIDKGTGWEPWAPFSEEAPENRFVTELCYLETDYFRVKIALAPGFESSSLKGRIHVFSPTGAIGTDETKQETDTPDAVCPCPIPAVVQRSSWGAAWNLNGNIYIPPAVYTSVTHLIVHHSAGANSSSNWPGAVAAIFDFHVNTNGWSDVGYNWLIDPNGVLYEGRGGGNNVRGAHMCGFNNNTMGVCLLGNFVSVPPPAAALNTLKKLFAWKSCNSNINPTGSGPITSYPGTMQNISGHRDGCSPNATECPGGLLHTELPALRLAVAQHIQTVCSSSHTHTQDLDQPTVSPNPVQDHLLIQWPEMVPKGKVIVRDATGRTLFLETFDSPAGEWKILVPGLLNGVYFIEIQCVDRVYVKIVQAL
jgi:N-acetylmuramoyl-L-alanine amidase